VSEESSIRLITEWKGNTDDQHRVADGDDFIGNLWKVHCRVREEGYVQASHTTTMHLIPRRVAQSTN
jgi:hypothetical protein